MDSTENAKEQLPTPKNKKQATSWAKLPAYAQQVTLLTPEDVALRWRISKMTLRRWRAEGKVKALRMGRGVRFSLAEIERYEAARIA